MLRTVRARPRPADRGVDQWSERAAGWHVPVLLDRCLELLGPARWTAAAGPVHVDATLGLGGHAEAVLDGASRTLRADRARPRPEALAPVAASGSRPFADRIHLVHAVYDELPEVLDRLGLSRRSTACCSTSGSRRCSSTSPSRGFAYAQDAPLDMRMDPTTGHHRRARWSTPTRPATWPGCCGCTARSSSPRRIAAAIVRERARGADHVLGRGWPSWSGTSIPAAPGAPAGTRPSGRSRPCGSRSTASWPRSSGRCRPRSTRSRSAAGSSSCPTTRWRTGSSSGRSPPGRARTGAGRPAGRAARHRADAAPAHPRRRAGRRGRGGRQPARRLGAAAGGGADRPGRRPGRPTGTRCTSRTAAPRRGTKDDDRTSRGDRDRRTRGRGDERDNSPRPDRTHDADQRRIAVGGAATTASASDRVLGGRRQRAADRIRRTRSTTGATSSPAERHRRRSSRGAGRGPAGPGRRRSTGAGRAAAADRAAAGAVPGADGGARRRSGCSASWCSTRRSTRTPSGWTRCRPAGQPGPAGAAAEAEPGRAGGAGQPARRGEPARPGASRYTGLHQPARRPGRRRAAARHRVRHHHGPVTSCPATATPPTAVPRRHGSGQEHRDQRRTEGNPGRPGRHAAAEPDHRGPRVPPAWSDGRRARPPRPAGPATGRASAADAPGAAPGRTAPGRDRPHATAAPADRSADVQRRRTPSATPARHSAPDSQAPSRSAGGPRTASQGRASREAAGASARPSAGPRPATPTRRRLRPRRAVAAGWPTSTAGCGPGSRSCWWCSSSSAAGWSSSSSPTAPRTRPPGWRCGCSRSTCPRRAAASSTATAVLAGSAEARYVFADPALVKDPAGDRRRAARRCSACRARNCCPS